VHVERREPFDVHARHSLMPEPLGVRVQPWPHLSPEARITPPTPFTR
jgi:hypothetical protein